MDPNDPTCLSPRQNPDCQADRTWHNDPETKRRQIAKAATMTLGAWMDETALSRPTLLFTQPGSGGSKREQFMDREPNFEFARFECRSMVFSKGPTPVRDPD